ncbi:hypothetical protein D3C80_1385710 [compost metagenome]
MADNTCQLVHHLLACGDRHDFSGEQPCRLRRRRALLRLQGVDVLCFAAYAITPGHPFGRLQHRHVGMLAHAQYRGVISLTGQLVVHLLHQADLLLTCANGHLHAINHDLLRRRGNGHQA